MAGLLGLGGLRRANRHERAGIALYGAAVAAAREPWFYLSLGVPDTLDGRFDLIALHAFLLVHRLQDDSAPGPDLAQAVFDAMFSDMDNNLREIGVSDLYIAQNEKDQALESYVQALRSFWANYYRLRRVTLYDFMDKTELR